MKTPLLGRSLFGLATAVAVSTSSYAAVPVASARSATPNVVVILIDDLGWRDVACYGSRYYETPNIDRLAAQGMRFTQGYSNATNCSPSRACLLTGMYTPRHGIYTNGTSERGEKELRKIIPPKNTEDLNARFGTIANALGGVGYKTASIGKWNLGDDATGPIAHGFDVNVAGSRKPFTLSHFSPYHNKDIKDGPALEYLTDRLTDEAVRFIKQNAEHPFFLYLSHYAVHFPWEAKPDLIEHFRNKPADGVQNNPIYAAMVSSMDESVGRIMAALDAAKLSENTLVIFTSDNGGESSVTDLTPLRGGKASPYEGGFRVPLIARWPGRVRPGSECAVSVAATDFLPTFLELTGAKPLNQPMDGTSIVPLLTGQGAFPTDRALYWYLPTYFEAIEPGYLQKDPPADFRGTPCCVMQKNNWKLIEFFEDQHLELYNLAQDLGEAHNLAEPESARAAAMLAEMKAWQKDVKAFIPTEPNPAFRPERRLHTEFGNHDR